MVKYILPLLVLVLISACGGSDDDQGPTGLTVEFDRADMLTHWMEDIFIPKQKNVIAKLEQLQLDLNALATTSGGNQLRAARTSFDNTYLAFQQMSPFILSYGEGLRLRELTNTYPTDVQQIQANFGGSANLDLPSNTDAQGLPALDYLLFSEGPLNDEPIVVTNPAAVAYAQAIVTQLLKVHEAHLTVLEDNREDYIANDGNSATASIDRTVNDYLFHYEKFLRAGKVAIPAGVFSDDPLPNNAESLYQGKSKPYFFEALKASKDFFNQDGLKEYMDAIEGSSVGDKLSPVLSRQFTAIENRAAGLNDSFQEQVLEDNTEMLAVYDEMQKLTVLLKVDMLQLMNINVDYVDADGD
ncbi:imelysin family protein [Lewinella sp. 4G2]|uniref:imelysin family protein n=1 Tax=Lewinella sp. 4G2 TaxID=1803372 RepID=UPI0007B4629F|nr:imelysin family protein [Lewinella sp. 4G2]OAV45038.1 hypothetical protein A3850_011305 [Lewinella sp. 4G2]